MEAESGMVFGGSILTKDQSLNSPNKERGREKVKKNEPKKNFEKKTTSEKSFFQINMAQKNMPFLFSVFVIFFWCVEKGVFAGVDLLLIFIRFVFDSLNFFIHE